MFLYLGIACLAFMLNYHYLKTRILEYEITASIIYLLAFIFIKSFDVIYVIYALFFAAPLIRQFRYIKRTTLLCFAYIAFELLAGAISNPLYSVAAVFLTRLFVIPFTIQTSANPIKQAKEKDDSEQSVLRMVMVGDVLVACVLVIVQKADYFVVEHQPVGANLSLVSVLLLLDISLKEENVSQRNRVENIIYCLVVSSFAVFSGIRGYILVVIPCATLATINYISHKGKRTYAFAIATLFACLIVALSLVQVGPLAQFFSKVDMSIGYRTLENEFLLKAMAGSNPVRWVVGYGVGAQGYLIGSEGLIRSLSTSQFHYQHLKYGVALLNYWLTILKDLGLAGLVMYVGWYIKMIGITGVNRERKAGRIFYAILYAIMLTYRTSCTNGLIELFTLSFIANNFAANDAGSAHEIINK